MSSVKWRHRFCFCFSFCLYKSLNLEQIFEAIFPREFPWINHNFFFFNKNPKKFTEYTNYLYRSLPQISQCWLQFNAWLNYMSPCSCWCCCCFFFLLSEMHSHFAQLFRFTYFVHASDIHRKKAPESQKITEKNKKGKKHKKNHTATNCKCSRNFHFIENHHECA